MDINDAIKELTIVKPGQDVSEVASAARMNAIQTMLIYIASGGHINTGPGMRKRTGTGWVTLSSDAKGGRKAVAADEFPFQLIGLVEATSEFDPTLITRVRVVQGKINGEFPDGMGFDDDPTTQFKLDITDDTTIVAQVTFDPDTLGITSRTVFESDDPDDSEITEDLGTLNFEIGYAQIEFDAESNPTVVDTQNNFVGNMMFELVYGALNGRPALIPVATYGIGFIGMPP